MTTAPPVSEPLLRCLPEGVLLLEGKVPRKLGEAWAAGDAAGLLELTLGGVPDGAEASLGWLALWGRAFLNRLGQVRDLGLLTVPGEAERVELLGRRPPFAGAEWVTEEVLLRLWADLTEVVRVRAGVSLEDWLVGLGGEWQGVGRVTFHLAENKNDAVRPFAFLATYAERVSGEGKLQHLLLAKAVQQYASDGQNGPLQSLLAPVRAAAEKSEWVKRMLETRQLFQALVWTPEQAFELVRELEVLRGCGVVVKVPDWWKGGRPARPVVQVVLEAEKGATVGAGAMLAFRLSICLEGEPLSKEELAKIREAKSGLVTLRGRWVQMDAKRLDEVMTHWQRVQRLHEAGGISFHQGMRYLSGFDGMGAGVELHGFDVSDRAEWSDVVAGEGFQKLLQQVREPEAVDPPVGLRATLRPYQLRGLSWLWFMQRLGLGACLADDMGLGKTIQVIALLLRLKQAGAAKPSLIVCPASLVGNWAAECGEFAPELRVAVVHGERRGFEESADVVLTTYTMVTKAVELTKARWELIILDEAQAIKNPGTQQTQSVKALKGRARIALTGTPVENRPGDLWSLFDFLNPGLLGGAASFAEHLKAMSGSKGTDYGPLRRLAGPYLLRRMKTDKRIIADLPEKIEVKERCGLTRRQAVIYTRLVEELRRVLNDPTLEGIQKQGQVLGFLMKFKQVCNHPSHYSGDGQYQAEDSGKFLRLAELAAEIAEKQERVLVFTQFQEMCEPLAAHLAGVFGREGLVLHGGTPVAERQMRVERFQAPGGPPFFVISVKAGGTGLTLTAASQVIHFDRWWNPAVENQATDRAFRIGQKKNVLVHKFVVAGTLEERVDRLLEEKQALSEDLLGQGTGAERLISEMSGEEVLGLVALDLQSVG